MTSYCSIGQPSLVAYVSMRLDWALASRKPLAINTLERLSRRPAFSLKQKKKKIENNPKKKKKMMKRKMLSKYYSNRLKI